VTRSRAGHRLHPGTGSWHRDLDDPRSR
jgi:hypothetical protein